MVSGAKAQYSKIVLIFTALALTVCMVPISSYAYKPRQKPKTHFLSWESANANETYRSWRKTARPQREFEVEKKSTVTLKKASFWNKRPVQFATPVSSGDMLYVGSNGGRFYCIETEKNKKRWEAELGGVEAPAALDGESVYVGDVKGYAYSFDAKTGTMRWKSNLANEILSAPLIVGGSVYFVTMDGRLFALDKSTGTELWHGDAMERTVGFTVRRQSSPVYYNGKILYGTSRGTLMAFREDGSVAWARLLGMSQSQVMDIDSRPLIVNGLMYVTSADGGLFCVDPDDGNVQWSLDGGGSNDVLYHNGRLYSTWHGKLASIDPSTGTIFWEQNLEIPGLSSPAGGNGFIAVVSTKDKLYLVDSENGDIVFERYVSKGSFGDPLVIGGDKLYLLSNSSKLYSFTVHEKVKKEKKKKQ